MKILFVAIEETHNLGAGAFAVRVEAAAFCANGDLILKSPLYGIGVILALGHIGESSIAFRLGAAGRAPHKGHGLGAGALAVGIKAAACRAGGDLIFHRPLYRFGVIFIRRHVTKADVLRGFGAAGRTPEEGHDLGAGAGNFGGEGGAVARTGYDALFNGPSYRLGIIGIGGDVREALAGGGVRVRVRSGRGGRDYGRGGIGMLNRRNFFRIVVIAFRGSWNGRINRICRIFRIRITRIFWSDYTTGRRALTAMLLPVRRGNAT